MENKEQEQARKQLLVYLKLLNSIEIIKSINPLDKWLKNSKGIKEKSKEIKEINQIKWKNKK